MEAALDAIEYNHDVKAVKLRKLLKNSPNISNPQFLNPAARIKGTIAIEVLLDAGAYVNGTNEIEETALGIAAFCRNLPAVQLLLSRGADIELGNPSPVFNAIHAVLTCGDTKAVMLQELLKHSPDISDPQLLEQAAGIKGDVNVKALLKANAVNKRIS
jgi:ankyrin repeat protein